jgi:hypothetical protein
LQLEPTDLIEALEQAIEATRPAIDARGHDSRIALPLTVRGDRVLVKPLAIRIVKSVSRTGRSYTTGHSRAGILMLCPP